MQRFNKHQLKQSFTYVAKVDVMKDEGIALLFVEAIFSGILPRGSAFPTQASLADHFKIPHTMVERIWKSLKSYHRVIESRRGYGTMVVRTLPDKKLYRLREELSFKMDRQKLAFDYESLHQPAYVNSSYDSAFNKMMVYSKNLPLIERHTKWKNSFTWHCRNRVNNGTGFSFTEGEIYYSQDRHMIIYDIMKTLLLSDEVVLLTQPVQQEVKDIVREVKRKFIVIPSDAAGLNLDQIEKECLNGPVGLVYISLTMLYQAGEMITGTQKYRLALLQEKHGFTIVFDDLQPLFTNFTENELWSENAKIIYIRPISMLTPATYETAILAGNEDTMKKLRGAFKRRNGVTPELGFALTNFLEYDKLEKYELKEYKAAMLVCTTIKKIFLDSGLWREDKLDLSTGWFFYLEPKQGAFPAGIYKMLIKKNIYVLDPAAYDADPVFSKGIFMSLSSRKPSMAITRDINEFNTVIKTMIS